MEFRFEKATELDADAIASWKQEEDYSCYDTDKNEIDLDVMLSSDAFDFFVALNDENERIGFVECTFDEEGILEIGCALLPDHLGKGYGCPFIQSCLEHVVEFFDYGHTHIITLIRHTDEHAIKVYERAGFQVVDESEDWVEMSVEV